MTLFSAISLLSPSGFPILHGLSSSPWKAGRAENLRTGSPREGRVAGDKTR